jgi:hypothetical protein
MIIVLLMLLVIMMIVVLAVMIVLLMIGLSVFHAPCILSGFRCLRFVLRLVRTLCPEEIAHDGLHPLGERGKTLAQVIADGGAMNWILQHRDKARADSIHVAGQQVTHPVERLNNAHSGMSRPMQAAGRRVLKMNGQVAELDRF